MMLVVELKEGGVPAVFLSGASSRTAIDGLPRGSWWVMVERVTEWALGFLGGPAPRRRPLAVTKGSAGAPAGAPAGSRGRLLNVVGSEEGGRKRYS